MLLGQMPGFYFMQHFQPISFFLSQLQSLPFLCQLPLAHLWIRNFLLCSIRNFSHCCDSRLQNDPAAPLESATLSRGTHTPLIGFTGNDAGAGHVTSGITISTVEFVS